MLTGKRAFQHSTSAETMTAILHEDPPSVSQIARKRSSGAAARCASLPGEEPRATLPVRLGPGLCTGSPVGVGYFVGGLPLQGPEQRRRRKALAWWIGLAAMVAATIATYYFWRARREAPFAHYSLQRVIDSKHVGSIAISPDGVYLAAVLNDANGAQTLLLHHIPTNSERTIVQDPAYKFDRVTFSPDGSYIYFRIDAPGAAHGPIGGMTTGYRFSAVSPRE